MYQYEIDAGKAMVAIPEYSLHWIDGKPFLQIDELEALLLSEILKEIAAAILNPKKPGK